MSRPYEHRRSPASRASSRSSTSSGSPGSSCSTTRCSRSRACAHARCAAPIPRAPSLPPGRGRGSSVGSIVCYLTGLSHVDPVSNEPRSGASSTASWPRSRTSTSTSRATSARSSSSASPSATGRSRRARCELRDVPLARRHPRRREGARPPVRRARAACTAVRRLERERVGEEVARLPDGDRKLESKRWRAFAWLTGEIAGLPRHVSQHPGGMIVSTRPLIELVPVQPAAMAGRQLCQWDKDSCSDAGFLKIDPRPRDALGGRGLRRADRAHAHDETIDLSRIPSTTRRCTTTSSARTRSARSRSRAARRCRACCGRSRRTSTTSPSRSRSCARARSRERRCVHRRAAAARGPDVRLPGRPRAPARAAALDVRRRGLPGSGARGRGSRSPGFTWAKPRVCAAR